MGYTAEQMHQAQRANERAARLRGEVKRRGEFELVRSVDPRAYYNAIIGNGGVDTRGRHCWHDAEFCKDMDRRHPEIAVKPKGTRIMVQMGGRQIGTAGTVQGARALTRLGRSSFHKVYTKAET